MNQYFNTQDKIERLVLSAQKWMGTPWMANSSSIGRGVSCHNLPRTLLIEAGALPIDTPVIVGKPNRFAKVSDIATLLDSMKEFKRVELDDQFAPGDVIGIRIYRCIDHLGLMLDGGRFIHVLMHKKTDIDWVAVPPWQQRIEMAWRPMK